MKLYSFTPTEDLTTVQLALIMKVLFVSLIEGIQGQAVRGEDNLEVDDAIFNSLSKELQVYFVEKPDDPKGKVLASIEPTTPAV